MKTLLRGMALGAAYGLAAGTVGLWLELVGVIERRMGTTVAFSLEVVLLQIALGTAVGAIASPLLRLRAGRAAHILLVAIVWAALIKRAEIGAPLFAQVQYVPAVVGPLLLGIGIWLARQGVWVPWAAALLLLAGAVAAPHVYLGLTTPTFATRTSLPDPAPNAPDVVLVVLDTVRAESLSAYGYERPTSPALDALADEGALFLDATSPSTWSLASHASLFTGRYPSGHGAHYENRFLRGDLPTLGEALSRVGYDTFCFTANPWISDGLGLTRGFAQQASPHGGREGAMFSFIHRLLWRLFEPDDKGGGTVASQFEEWARTREPDARPAFVFLNFVEAHFPYHMLPEDFLAKFTDHSRADLRDLSLELMAATFGGEVRDPEAAAPLARDMYDAGVLYSDHLFARVAAALRERGTLDRTVLIMLSDHGEILGEKGGYFGHGLSLHQPMIRVPLYLRYPSAVPAGLRVESPVSTLGVYATILELIGAEPPPTLHVGSLVPALTGAGHRGPVLAERLSLRDMGGGNARNYPDPLMRADPRYRAYRMGGWKLIETSSGEEFLFDLLEDPREERDLAAERPAELARMRASLQGVEAELGLPALDAAVALGQGPELDAATRERLRALGYLE